MSDTQNDQFEVMLRNRGDGTIARRGKVASLEEAQALAWQYIRNYNPRQFHTQIWQLEPGSSAPPILVDGELKGGDE